MFAIVVVARLSKLYAKLGEIGVLIANANKYTYTHKYNKYRDTVMFEINKKKTFFLNTSSKTSVHSLVDLIYFVVLLLAVAS